MVFLSHRIKCLGIDNHSKICRFIKRINLEKWCAESIVGENKLKAKFEPYGMKGARCEAMGIYILCNYRTYK